MCQGAFIYEPFIAAEGSHVRRKESLEGPSLPAQVKEIQEALDASFGGFRRLRLAQNR